jgi:hypothetical protein
MATITQFPEPTQAESSWQQARGFTSPKCARGIGPQRPMHTSACINGIVIYW